MPVYTQSPPQPPERKKFDAAQELNDNHPSGTYMRTTAGMLNWFGYAYEIYSECGEFNGTLVWVPNVRINDLHSSLNQKEVEGE